MKLSELNDYQQSLIDEDDRKRLKIRLLSERVARAQAGMERKEHGQLTNWCLRNRVKCIHAPCTRKVKDLEPGFPDFMFYRGGLYLLVEMKVAHGNLSEEQKKLHQELRDQGDEIHVTWSADETIRLLRGWLWEHFRWLPTEDADA